MSWRNFTAFVYFSPDRYIIENTTFGNIDIDAFSRRFEYKPDQLAGIADFATSPWETWATGEGDCEDYALFIASCLLSRDADNVGLGFCYNVWPPQGHVVAFDDTRVYSSGAIYSETFREHRKRWDITSRRMLE